MKKIILSLLCLFLATTSVFAQIEAPEKVNQHELIVFGYKSPADTKFVDISIHRVYKITVNNKEIEVLESEQVQSLPLNDSKYVFTGPPGLYKVIITYYVVDKSERDFSYIQISGDEIGPGPNPDPKPNPNPPDPDINLTGLALDIYKVAMSVQSQNRKDEAKILATCFETIASRAAGLNMSPQQMATDLSTLLKEKLPENIKSKWSVFNSKYVDLMKSVKSTKDDYIDAYLQVAEGLKAIK
jgi:hypothetical protein